MYRCNFIVVLLLFVICGEPVQAQVNDEQVQIAIERIKNRLYAAQNEWGTWDPRKASPPMDATQGDLIYGTNFGGTTALATYALLTAGESYQDPRLRKALAFLANTRFNGVYANSFRNHVWAQLPPQFSSRMQQDTKWLVNAIGGGPAGGGYTYQSLGGKSGRYDNSNTQYGVLGAWEGAKRKAKIPTEYWGRVEKHFEATQNADGGWGYVAGSPLHAGSTGSMTAAGLACLFIAQDYQYGQDFRRVAQYTKHPLTKRINSGLAWFDRHFSAVGNPSTDDKAGVGPNPYYLVGVERVALASGLKYIGGQDWYRDGAELLTGRIPGGTHNLAFSLIFLVRGRVPIFINKLSVSGLEWNNRPRDVGRLTAWVSDEVEQEMNWQIVDIAGEPEDWLDAPLLYLASHQALNLSDAQAAKIKRYIDLGGMVITVSDVASTEFSRSVQELYRRIYPEYSLKALDAKDEINEMVFPIRSGFLNAMSLHNGVRHLALHIPRDVSWILHAGNEGNVNPWHFFANAYYYATERNQARPRLAEHVLRRRGRTSRNLGVARVQYDGNWNPEPAAWEVQSNWLANEQKVDANVQVVELSELTQLNGKFAHIVGTEYVEFGQVQIDALKAFVASGGTVLFENVGGRGAFSQSAMAMLVKAFPDHPIRPLSQRSKVVQGETFDGYDLSEVDYRAFTLLLTGRFKNLRLQALSIDDEPRIFVSGEDLSTAMLDQPVWGVYGYSVESARKIMTNLLLWAHRKPGAG